MAEKLEDALQPAHELGKETIVVYMDLMDELVEIVLVPGAKVDEGLDGLIWVCGDVLPLCGCDYGDGVISE